MNPQAVRWEIWCNDAGYSQVPPGSPYPPNPRQHPRSHASTVASGRVLSEFQVVYLTAGRGWFRSAETGLVPVGTGDAIIVFPGVLHAYRPDPETGWQEYWVGFSGEHAMRLWNNRLFTPEGAVQPLGLNPELVADYERIIALCREQTPGFQVRLGSLVLQLLAHIHTAEREAKTGTGDGAVVELARAVMQEHLDDGLSVQSVARRTGVGYSRLLRVFRQYTGLTPYQYYLQLRIGRSQELLRESDISIKEVAARMSFDNQYYFSRIFKQKTGMSPSEWRARQTTADPPRAQSR